MANITEDMTGWKMWEHGVPDSRLTVIKKAENSKRGQPRWICECNCLERNQITVIQYNLTRTDGNATKSCGCLKKEKMSTLGKENKKYNKFILNLNDEYGDYGIGICNNSGNKFYFDMDDYVKIKDYCWADSYTSNNLHVLTTWIDGRHYSMHKLLGMLNYDHVDRNELNNRRYNLRPCTHQENCRNKNIRTDNKSGVTGVYFSKEHNKWRAQIKINGKNTMVYYGNSKEDAIKARLETEAKYYGEFAPQRHLFEQYEITNEVNLNE